ncbi:hypothetical protein [Phenylobacterium sp.]|uniref:hypothetical protein n=1 Tax=Phenylobacterium sp. TaxID=1871053 RepID=UPI00301B965C
MTGLVAAALIFAGSLTLYLATPAQKAVARPLGRPWMVSGWVELALGLGVLLTILGPATAVFTWMTGAMLVWSVVPLGVAWWRGPPKGKR